MTLANPAAQARASTPLPTLFAFALPGLPLAAMVVVFGVYLPRFYVGMGADFIAVAGAIACIVDTPFGERPFRVHIDPSGDGASVAFAVIDRIRDEMLNRVGFANLLKPRVVSARE